MGGLFLTEVVSIDVEIALKAVAAIAGAAVLGQIVCRRLPIPLPLFLLGAGLLVGQDGLGFVDPNAHEVRELSEIVVVLAVALVVFEGGTALRLSSLRTLAPIVRNMVLLGLIVTPAVGAVAAVAFLDFDWRLAFLFGALVCVTGPSVITPLLRSFRVDGKLRDILASEGVLIDPFGALLTLFVLKIELADTLNPVGAIEWVAERFAIGGATGAGGALVVWLIARYVQRLSGREMATLVLGAAVATFAIAENWGHESGLTAMVVMSIAIGNLPLPQREQFVEFQESIIIWLIASVYVLLAAAITFDGLLDLWPEGLIVVGVLAFVGRPLLIFLASFRSGLNWREKTFLSAVAPRGVVAASLAGVVAVDVSDIVGDVSEQLVAMVFLVILLTIGVQSLYAPTVARLLKVQPMVTVIAGAGVVGRRIASHLAGAGEPVLLIEKDEAAAVDAREDGFDVFIGDVADTAVLERVGLADAKALILATPDDAQNLLAAQLAQSVYKCDTVYARVSDVGNLEAFHELGVTPIAAAEAVASEFTRLLEGPDASFRDVLAEASSDVTMSRVTVTNPTAQHDLQSIAELRGTLVVLVTRGSDSVIPNGRTELRLGDVVTVMGNLKDLEAARGRLSLASGAEPSPA